jgi:hypothetical protein
VNGFVTALLLWPVVMPFVSRVAARSTVGAVALAVAVTFALQLTQLAILSRDPSYTGNLSE